MGLFKFIWKINKMAYKKPQLKTISVADRLVFDTAIIEGFISLLGRIFEWVAVEGGDYDNSASRNPR